MRHKLLVVDDAEENSFVISTILDDFPIQIDSVLDGHEAIQKIAENDYFAVLMDIHMPEMDGFECVRRIRELIPYKHIPILFFSAVALDEDALNRGYHLGAVDYIEKSANPIIIRSKVRIFLELAQRNEVAEEALAALAENQRNQDLMLNHIADGVIAVDNAHKITYANTAACTLLTDIRKNLLGTDIKDIVGPTLSDISWDQSSIVQTFKEGQCQHCDDTYFWRNKKHKFPVQFTQSSILSGNDVVGGMLVFQDISERKELEKKLVSMTNYDPLTGLANRTSYWDFLEKTLSLASRSGESIYVLFIDLDNFKEVNDSLGHDAGDLLLVHAAERLRGLIRSSDMVARLGGDEFSIIIQQVKNEEEVAHICKKLMASFEEQFSIFGQDIHVGCSVGISHYPSDGKDVITLSKAADTAMYEAKKFGKNDYRFYEPKMQKQVKESIGLKNDLKLGLKNNEIIPYFQVKVDISSGKCIGAEALARWNKSSNEMISPAYFIPAAEKLGLISKIGDQVFRQASSTTKKCMGFVENKDFCISVNVSPKQLLEEGFVSGVVEFLDRIGLDAHNLELELTETVVMNHEAYVLAKLRYLRNVGVKISIDDFGTGYSSLAYLKKLPIDTLKIDQSFIRDIGHDSKDENIVRAVVNMAHDLGLTVIAEGVETEYQLQFLKDLSCDYGQGYLFSEPLPEDEFIFRLKGAC